ncbi:MAG TPA: DinB family protein [Caldilineaceae bacterium]|nr:DinB family protein [Caldilineaceae bacterium]
MTEIPLMTATIYAGWQDYQITLITALRPLSAEQLALRAAPHLRSIAQITAHLVAARANWFYRLLQEGGEPFARLGQWERSNEPTPSTAELIQGLETTWRGMQTSLARWSPDDWQQTYTQGHPYEPATITRQWVIWHLLEHDLHHGGEISLTLGMYGLAAPDR